MANITLKYSGNLRCEVLHQQSGTKIVTDAQNPSDGMPPVSVLAAALGTCTASMMGMFAARHEIDINGMEVSVDPVMEEAAHKIKAFNMTLVLPKKVSDTDLERLRAAAKSCPVGQALNPDITVTHNFICK